MLYITEIGF